MPPTDQEVENITDGNNDGEVNDSEVLNDDEFDIDELQMEEALAMEEGLGEKETEDTCIITSASVEEHCSKNLFSTHLPIMNLLGMDMLKTCRVTRLSLFSKMFHKVSNGALPTSDSIFSCCGKGENVLARSGIVQWGLHKLQVFFFC